MTKERDELVVNYMPLARKLAWKKCKNTPRSVTYEDLESAAFLGLVDASSKFDGSRYVGFGLYAAIRINGSMIDYLRELEWVGRNSDVKVTSLDITTDDFPLDYLLEASPEQEDHSEFFEVVTDKLNDVGKKVICMYYFKGISLKDIGKEIGVGESRVSQLLKKYRNALQQEWDYDRLFEMAA